MEKIRAVKLCTQSKLFPQIAALIVEPYNTIFRAHSSLAHTVMMYNEALYDGCRFNLGIEHSTHSCTWLPRAEHVFLSSKSVSEGHLDNMCDQISNAVLDTCLTSDPKGRVPYETCVKDNLSTMTHRHRHAVPTEGVTLVNKMMVDGHRVEAVKALQGKVGDQEC